MPTKVSDVYNSLDNNGKSYLSDLMGYSMTSPERLQRVLLERDKARTQGWIKKLPDKLNSVDKQMNLSIADSESHVQDQADILKVNHLMERNDVTSSLSNGNNLLHHFYRNHVTVPRWRRGHQDLNKMSSRSVVSSFMSNAQQRASSASQTQSNVPQNTSMATNADAKNQSPYFAENSPQQKQGTKDGVKLYQNLTKQGQRYFDMNMHFAKYGPQSLNRAKFGKRSNLNPSQQKARVILDATANGQVIDHGKFDMTKHFTPLTPFEQKRIDNYFRSKGGMTAIKYETLGKGLKSAKVQESIDKLNKQRAQFTPEARNKAVDKGMNMYDNLTPAGQNLFKANAFQASERPNDFHKFKTSDFGSLNKYQRKDYQHLYNMAHGIYNVHGQTKVDKNSAVPEDEHKKINGYFKKSVVPGVAGRLSNGIQKHDTHKLIDFPDESMVKTDYRDEDYERYRRMLGRGAKLYDGLSQQGRKYLFTASQEATMNLDDFDQAMNGNQNTLTGNPQRINRQLAKISGWNNTDNGKPIQINPNPEKSVNPTEKKLVDRYLKNSVTQEGLGRSDVYNTLLSKNLHNRQLLETQADEDQDDKIEKNHRHGSPLAEHIKRAHPVAYQMGYWSGAVFDSVEIPGMDKLGKGVNKLKKDYKKKRSSHSSLEKAFKPSKPHKSFLQRSQERLRKRTKGHHKDYKPSQDNTFER